MATKPSCQTTFINIMNRVSHTISLKKFNFSIFFFFRKHSEHRSNAKSGKCFIAVYIRDNNCTLTTFIKRKKLPHTIITRKNAPENSEKRRRNKNGNDLKMVVFRCVLPVFAH